MRRFWMSATFGVAIAALCGCSDLPSAGTTASQLKDSVKNKNDLGFKIVALTPAVVGVINAAPAETIASLAGSSVPADVERIGIGDVLSITTFSAGPRLFSDHTEQSPNPAEPATVSQSSLPKIIVDDQGSIEVPYVGTVVAAGLTPVELEKRIEVRLRNKALEPQVVVLVERNVANTVVVSGDVKSPGRYPLTLAHETLLDMLAGAGGSSHTSQDVVVRVTRGNNQGSVRLSRISALGPENIRLSAGDRIEVLFEPRSYTAFGASGKVSEVRFETGDISLASALARAGGPLDSLADPSAIYIFRFERPEVAQSFGLQPGTADPVIYHIDLRQAQSYFVIQKFEMRDKDVVFVASARSDALQKLMNILNTFFAPAFVTKTLVQ